MHTTNELLDQPASRAARVVALELLDAATKARERLENDADADALHDFRVRIRRLRSWLRALEPWLGDSTPKKARRRLAKAARLSSESRDAEVHLEWLRAQRVALSVRQRRGLVWLVDRIEADKHRSDKSIATKGIRAFDRAREALTRRLPEYRARIDVADDVEPFASAIAALLRDQAAVVARRLTKIEAFEDNKAAHAARIAGKRLRYVLEPIAKHVPGAEELVASLSQLQDTLGDWHDVHVFSSAIVEASEMVAASNAPADEQSAVEGDELPPARPNKRNDVQLGLLALAARLHERGQRAFAEATRQSALAAALLEQVDAVAGSLMNRPAPQWEIGRKYLLSGLPAIPDDAKVVARRYTVRERDHRWEIEEFLDRDIVLAEAELTNAAEEPPPPPWLAPMIDRDVTGDAAYENATLASGDRRVAEQAEEEREEKEQRQSGGDRAADRAPVADEPRAAVVARGSRLEEPAVGESPRT